MERNEAGRKEAMEAKALEEANMVMGVGELRKAYEQKIAQEVSPVLCFSPSLRFSLTYTFRRTRCRSHSL